MVATFQAKTAIRATGLAMLSMLALLAVILAVESYKSDKAKAIISAHRAAHVVATQYGWMFEASAHSLQRMEEAVLAGPASATAKLRSLGTAVSDLPHGFSYAVHDADGRLVQSGKPETAGGSVSSTAWFRAARAGRELSFAPLSKGTEPVTDFVIVRRIDRNGTFLGTASITIPVSGLTTLAETLGLGSPSTIALVLSDGTLLARTPPVPSMNLSGWQLFTETARSPDGTFEAVSPADGVTRIIGYWQLPDWPVIALSGFDRSSALRPFWRNLLTSALLALPILLGMGWLVLDLVHLMRVDERRQIALADAIERTNYLLREIHHRVKNNLQTVSSLIRLELPPFSKACSAASAPWSRCTRRCIAPTSSRRSASPPISNASSRTSPKATASPSPPISTSCPSACRATAPCNLAFS